MQEELICPYPGLRPFNEDEAIFFKGRDEHIEQITRQLEEKKFLMLTGASGDGKSSLVYAGLIPNARAGFFKAKFGNWIVVDFRPERTPLKNLADALSDKFGAKEKERFQNELQFGFSALIDIYTQSPYYVNKNSVEFLSLEEAEKKKATRKGANLMILVDQFEEFFTNTENYSNGKTSVDSQLVVNLILETSRIALEKDIPIYVICTMRSDYIGQCASFRGLPEAIGFSQFFVPRLKRNEIYQVIQEPALLNGNKISKRLIEVLINEMNDGIDQLPVLQHALNQVWQIADKGKTEMDLIHFAKIGGLDTQYLTKDDKKIFDDWFEKIPEYKKRFFEHPSLDNVLDGHANDLYYRAFDYLKAKQPDSKITIDDTQLIIRNAFKCLTKIDQSRGVRNRMTLSEIVNIIDQSHITDKEVATVLEIFRLQGNTFLKPFYTEGGKENDLLSDSVLDITHESLIRNWSNLIEWAHEEDEDYHIWLDFEKQLHRWIENDKSNGYLLPIGPLNFFETWINKKKPNKYWLLKYDESDLTLEEKIKKADTLLKNAHQFIKRSARKLFVSRTILKYGAQKVAIVISSVLVTLACIYLYFDYASKKNEAVLALSEERGLELLRSDKVKAETKAQFLLLYEERYPGKIAENLASCGNDSTQIRVAFEIFNRLKMNLNVFTSQRTTIELADKVKMNLSNYLFEKVARPLYKNSDTLNYSGAVRLYWILNSFNLAQIHSLDKDFISSVNKFKSEIFDVLYEKYLMSSLVSKSAIDGPELFNAVSLLLISNKYDKSKLENLIKLFSPFTGADEKELFNISFAKSAQITDNNLALKYNGGYELLASLYAYCGDFEKSIQSLDSIISYDTKFSSRWSYGYQDVAQSYWLGTDGKDSIHDFIYKLSEHRIKQSGGEKEKLISQFSYEAIQSNLWMNSNAIFRNKGIINYINTEYYTFIHSADEIFKWYENRIWKLDLPVNEVHYLQANILKYQAVTSLYLEDTTNGFTYLRRFKKIIEAIDKDFLKDTIAFGESSNQVKTTRRAFLLIPTYVSQENSWSFTSTWSNSTPYMLHFYNSWKLLDKYDFTDKELNIFATCVLNDINELPLRYANKYYENRSREIWDFISVLKNKFKDKDRKKELELISRMMQTINTKKLYQDDNNKFLSDEEEKDYLNKEYYNSSDNVLIAKLNILRIYLLKKIKSGKINDIYKFIDLIENKAEKNNLILDVCDQAITLGYDTEAIHLLNYYIKQFNSSKKPPALFYVLVGQVGGHDLLSYSKKLLKDSEENAKPSLFKYLIRGMAQKSEYYLAYSLIPESISSNSELEYISEILRAEFLSKNDFEMQVEKSWLSNMTNWYESIYETNQSGGMTVIF